MNKFYCIALLSFICFITGCEKNLEKKSKPTASLMDGDKKIVFVNLVFDNYAGKIEESKYTPIADIRILAVQHDDDYAILLDNN